MTDFHFNGKVAEEVGIPAAVLYHNIRFWCQKNAANERHYHDGRTWTYNSISAFCELFPFLSEKQIRKALNDLEQADYIGVGCYNEDQRDRTKWYCDKRAPIRPPSNPSDDSDGKKGRLQLPLRANALAPEGEPLPDNKQHISPYGDNTRKRANPLPILSKALSPKIAEALIAHRKAKGAKLTDHAADLLLAKFEKAREQLGMTPDQCANMMIERGWQGFEIAWVTRDRQQVQYANHRPQMKIDPLEELARMKANGQTITGFGSTAQIGNGR